MLLKDDTNLLERLVHVLHPGALPVARRPLVLFPLPFVLKPVGARLSLLVLLEASGGHPLDQDVHRVLWSRSRRRRGIQDRVGDVNCRTGILDLRFGLKIQSLMQMTHISGEGNVDTVVLSLLWRLHLVPLLSAWVLQQLFWTHSQNIYVGCVLKL